ncbi:hypothetical protein [Persephonella sp.]
MIKTETKIIYLVSVINEIQKETDNVKLLVKVDFGEAIEVADIELTVYVFAKKTHELHKKINSIIQYVLEKYDLMPCIHWDYEN